MSRKALDLIGWMLEVPMIGFAALFIRDDLTRNGSIGWFSGLFGTLVLLGLLNKALGLFYERRQGKAE